MSLTRRAFLIRGAGALAGILSAPARGVAQQDGAPQTNMGPMDRSAHRTTRRPPKPNAVPVVSVAERDALEHRIRCQCACTLDVYTCRTTDFTCPVSPAMHRDVLSLIEGGYDASEILAAFEETYGERVLMAPKRQGFNWVGYLAPFAALGTGGVLVAMLIRRWGSPAAEGSATHEGAPSEVAATAEELARLEDVVRGEDR